MQMKNWLNAQISGKQKKTMPILSFPCISLLDITVRQLVESSDLQAKGMKLVADAVDSSAAVSMMDLSVEAETFGSEIIFTDDEVPTVRGAVVSTEEDAEALKIPAVGSGRTGTYIDAIEKSCKMITDRPVFAGVIGPFSLAGRLMDVGEAMANCIDEPDMVHAVMEKTTEFLINYINAYKAVGANGVVLAEPLTGMLSPSLAAEFSEPYVRKINEAVQDDEFIVIYHNCGDNTIYMIDSILATGSAAYHFGNAIKMSEMLPHIPSDILVMGNVDPAGVIRAGTPEGIYSETTALLKECTPNYPNFVISSGCDIPPLTSWENIHAYFKAVKDFYQI